MNKRVLVQTFKKLDKVTLRNMGLAKDNNLVALEDGLI